MIPPSFTPRYRFCQSSFDRPSGLNTFTQIADTYPGDLRPLGYIHCPPLVGYQVIGSAVVALLCNCCPTAVGWLIVTVVIDAVKRVLLAGPRPHVFVESLEGITPTTADLDTTAAVVVIVAVGRPGTSLDRRVPGLVFWRVPHSVYPSSMPTPAVLCSSTREAVAKNFFNVATSTGAKPNRVFVLVITNITKHSQTAESFAGQVLYAFVGNGYNLLSHVRTPYTNVMRGLRGVRSALQSPLFYHIPEKQQLGTLAPDGMVVGQGLEGF